LVYKGIKLRMVKNYLYVIVFILKYYETVFRMLINLYDVTS